MISSKSLHIEHPCALVLHERAAPSLEMRCAGVNHCYGCFIFLFDVQNARAFAVAKATASMEASALFNFLGVVMYSDSNSLLQAQAQAEAQKMQMQRWQVMMGVQNTIFQMTQDVTINRMRTADRAFNAFDNYIRS